MNLSTRLKFSTFLNVPFESASNLDSPTDIHSRKGLETNFALLATASAWKWHFNTTPWTNDICGLTVGFPIALCSVWLCKMALQRSATANSFSFSPLKMTVPGGRQRCTGAAGEVALQKYTSCSIHLNHFYKVSRSPWALKSPKHPIHKNLS